MKLSRDLTHYIRFFLDELVPPVIRDSKWFMWLPFKLAFGKKSYIFFQFKQQAPLLSEVELRQVYLDSADIHINRETDINRACMNAIKNYVIGKTVLDVACGSGFLAKYLSREYKTTACDIIIAPELIEQYPDITFKEAQVEHLPFSDNAFDTVICAHTLEHVMDLHAAIAELRRVTAKRLIVIVPKQRPYKYTFDLHIQFFPLITDIFAAFGRRRHGQICMELNGDWFYLEEASDK